MPDIYAVRSASVTQRLFLAASGFIGVAVAWWLLMFRGTFVIAGWLRWHPEMGDLARRICLGTALTIYFVRLLFTEFVFLKRGVGWSEAFTVAPWVFCITIWFCLAGGTNPTPPALTSFAGATLFVLGSWMNSGAEYARHQWKKKPGNSGKLYTRGWFRLSRHPNYFGDVLSFSGLSLIAGRLNTGIIPLLMLAGFLFVNVPALDAHLKRRYGAQFDDWARRTPKLIPFLY
jgi:protein-S-isoprenylcysteine O-methyltransferase Ste14